MTQLRQDAKAASTRAAPHKPPRASSNPLLAGVRLAAFLAATVLLYTCFVIARMLARNRDGRLRTGLIWTHRWARTWTGIAGFRVRTEGSPPPPGSFLAPNHIGYADIPALASVVQCFFLAKSEIAAWPVIGLITRTSYHLFVVRKRHRGMHDTLEELKERLHCGYRVCVFLEGTSSGGEDVLPFRPSLLKPAIEAGASIVPVAITWTADNPDVDIAGDVAYWGEHSLPPHLWRQLGLRGLTATIRFGDPVKPAKGADRKHLAEALRNEVRQMRRGEEQTRDATE